MQSEINCPKGSPGIRVFSLVSDDIRSFNLFQVYDPKTMQYSSSVQHLGFVFNVPSFPIGLSPRTMQDLSSV